MIQRKRAGMSVPTERIAAPRRMLSPRQLALEVEMKNLN
jgi:hypothetical protein